MLNASMLALERGCYLYMTVVVTHIYVEYV